MSLSLIVGYMHVLEVFCHAPAPRTTFMHLLSMCSLFRTSDPIPEVSGVEVFRVSTLPYHRICCFIVCY